VNRTHLKRILIFTLMILGFSQNGFADLKSLIGPSVMGSALSGSNRIYSYDAFSLSNNVATSSDITEGLWSLNFIGGQSAFKDISNVVIDNTFTGGASVATGNISTNVSPTAMLLLGVVTPVFKSHWLKPKLSFNIQSPIDKLAEVQTQDYYRPSYSLYKSDTQRLGFSLGGSLEPLENFSVGLGGSLFFTTASNVVAKMPTSGNTSSLNTNIAIKPALALLVGVKYKLKNHHFGMHYSGAKDYRSTFDVETSIGVLSSPVPLNFTASNSLYYDPAMASVGYSFIGSALDIHLAVDYEMWSPFDGSIFKINYQTFTTQLSQTRPNSQFQDILVPRLGAVYKFDSKDIVAMGYAFRPSPTPELNKTINLVDSDRHIFSAGYRKAFEQFSLDAFLQGQSLIEQNVKKVVATDIGAPGYQVGGWFLAYGLGVNVGF
jgi:hypothetical protein